MKIKKIRDQYICSQFCEYRKFHYCNKFNVVCLSCDFHEKLENPKLKSKIDMDNELKSQLACQACIDVEINKE